MWEPPLALALLLHSYFAAPNARTDAGLDRHGRVAGASASKMPPTGEPGTGLALHSAVRAGDAEQVTRLLDAGADPNSLDPLGGTPLLTACRLGHTSGVC